MAKARSINILQYKGSRVISIVDPNGNEYRMDYWGLHRLLMELVDTEWFKDKQPKWKYKRLDFEETYKHLLYHPALHKLINIEEEIK